MRFLLGGTGDSSLDSELVTDGSAGLEDRATGGKVDGGVVAGGGYNGGFLAVVGLGAGAEFTLSKVDDGAVRTVAVVEFDARLEVVGGGRGWLRSEEGKGKMWSAKGKSRECVFLEPDIVVGEGLASLGQPPTPWPRRPWRCPRVDSSARGGGLKSGAKQDKRGKWLL